MLKKIVGGFLIVISLLVVVIEGHKDGAEIIPTAIVLIVIGTILLLKKSKTKEEKTQQKKEKEIAIKKGKMTLGGKHFSGLPIGEGVVSTLFFGDNDLKITHSGGTFVLSYPQILSVEVKTDLEIQKSYVSSVGGAVGGAVLFGPLGAIIGGRAKQKKTTTVEYYLIVTYEKDDKIEYLSFQIFDNFKVRPIVQEIKHNFAMPKEINL